MRKAGFVLSIISTGFCLAGTANQIFGVGYAFFLPLGIFGLTMILAIASIHHVGLKQDAQETSEELARAMAQAIRRSEIDIWLALSLVCTVLGGIFTAIVITKGDYAQGLLLAGIVLLVTGNAIWQAHTLDHQERQISS
jgi:hypothetical protein